MLPALTDDAFLHCRLPRRLDVGTEIGIFDKAIECLYIVDYGVWATTDIYGQPVGYSRSIDYGTVVYAPTVGPVYSYERLLVGVADTLTAGAGDLEIGLIGTNAASAP